MHPEPVQEGEMMTEYTEVQIAAYTRGLQFHRKCFDEDGNPIPGMGQFKWLNYSEYNVLDMSPEAEAYWRGFEDSVYARIAARQQ
jgi:hypothetical protein